MLKTSLLAAAAMLAFGVAPALAQTSSSSRPMQQPRSSTPAQSATQAGRAAAANVATAPAVAVVVDPDARTAVVVPVNPNAEPAVTSAMAALYATGQIRPGQVAQIVVQHGNRITEVIANSPIP
jgi:5-enolpyruvylshikimate-3-phosphate synthase